LACIIGPGPECRREVSLRLPAERQSAVALVTALGLALSTDDQRLADKTDDEADESNGVVDFEGEELEGDAAEPTSIDSRC
jgi:hypothetical protein